MRKIEKKNLEKLSKILRQETFLAFIKKGEAHLGGSFSMIEILIYLFEVVLKKDDKFILSKAHVIPLCILLNKKGFNQNLLHILKLMRKQKFLYYRWHVLGFPISTGVALGNKILKKKTKTFVLVSDGECQEGTTWESFLIAAKHKLDNLYLVIDYNKIQALSKIEDVLPLDNLVSKIRSFNWNCVEIKNGHSFKSLIKGFNTKVKKGKPTAYVINTIKSKGIKEFEKDPVWQARKLKDKEINIGKKRLGIK